MDAYLRSVVPTYIENWPPALLQLSIPQVGLPLSIDEVRALRICLGAKRASATFNQTLVLDRLRQRIASALKAFLPDSVFVRLGSRSAKDSFHAASRGLRVVDAAAAVQMLVSGSERIQFDLALAARNHYQPVLFLRRWQDIPAWAEFRCFMRERRLIGISQYDCVNLGRCQSIVERADDIRRAIEAFFLRFRTAVHIDTVVFDVFLTAAEQHLATALSVRLLELNPFIDKTDRCLFQADEFDGSFRYL